MTTEIYYFSGTGNSFHVARELRNRLHGSELIPIVQLLQNDTIKTNGNTIGFVFPNFCLSLPIPVVDFLQKADLTSARYIFALCTRGGTESEAFDYMNKLLKPQGKKLKAQLNINMPWNHPLGKEDLCRSVNDSKRQELELKMRNNLDIFSRSILAHKEYIEPDTDATYKLPLLIKAFAFLIPKSFNYRSHCYMYQKIIHFYSDQSCNGCGVCERVCLSTKIEMIDNRPVWKEEVKCYGCFACINYCPRQSIQIASTRLFKSYTTVNGRYHHPAVSYKDIGKQRR